MGTDMRRTVIEGLKDRIREIEQQLGDLCQDEHLRIQELEAALREIRHQLWLNSQITGPMTNFARKIDEIAKQAMT